MEKRENRWIGRVYTLVLLLLALFGVICCYQLNKSSDSATEPQYYAEKEDIRTNGTDIIDLGDISVEVPLSDGITE